MSSIMGKSHFLLEVANVNFGQLVFVLELLTFSHRLCFQYFRARHCFFAVLFWYIVQSLIIMSDVLFLLYEPVCIRSK